MSGDPEKTIRPNFEADLAHLRDDAARRKIDPRLRQAEALERLASMAEARELRELSDSSFGDLLFDEEIDPGPQARIDRGYLARLRPLLSVQEQVAATSDATRAGDGGEAASPEGQREQPGDFAANALARGELWELAHRWEREAEWAGSPVGAGATCAADLRFALTKVGASDRGEKTRIESLERLLWMWLERDGNRFENDDLSLATYAELPGEDPPKLVLFWLEQGRARRGSPDPQTMAMLFAEDFEKATESRPAARSEHQRGYYSGLEFAGLRIREALEGLHTGSAMAENWRKKNPAATQERSGNDG